MKIKIENKEDIHKSEYLGFSQYLFCSSSTVKVSSNFSDFNSMYGSFLKEDSTRVGYRTFTISGNFDAGVPSDVESFRGQVFSQLFNKPLLLFLDDDTPLFYRCVLDGSVNTSYNQGWNIGRVFTLSFSLIANEPFAFDGVFHTHEGLRGKCEIEYLGTIPCCPIIEIKAIKDVILKENAIPFIQGNKSNIIIQKDIELKKGNKLYIKNGIPILNGKAIQDSLSPSSIFNPLFLEMGKNNFIIQSNDSLTVNIIFNNIFF